MNINTAFFIISCALCVGFLWVYVTPTFSLTSVALMLMLAFHGPAFLYYTQCWSLREGVAFKFFNEASSPRGQQTDVDGTIFYDRLFAAAKDPTIIDTLQLALGLALLLICVGVFFADKIFKKTPIMYCEAASRWGATKFLPLHRGNDVRLLVISGVVLVFLFHYIFYNDYVSRLLYYFLNDGGEFEKISLRRTFGNNSSYFFNLMLGTLLSFIAFSLWAWWRERGGMNGFLPWLTCLTVILVTCSKLAVLSKAPAVIFILELLVLEMARRSLLISFRHLISLSISSFLLFSLMVFLFNLPGCRSLGDLLLFLFYRIFMIPNESLLEYFACFPSRIPHTQGGDIRAFAIVFGMEPLQPNFWRVAESMRGTPGSTTTAMFIADAWAAFRWEGVVCVALAFGFLIRWLDMNLIINRGRSHITLAALGLGYHGIFIGMSTAFQTALLTGGLMLIVPAVIFSEWMLGRAARVDITNTKNNAEES